MARSSRQALRDLGNVSLAPDTARRSIKRVRKICRRRLRRNYLVSALVLAPPVILGLIILWGDNRFVPYVWQGARGILLAFWIVSVIAAVAAWLGMGVSTLEQLRVLGRLRREEAQIEPAEGVSA